MGGRKNETIAKELPKQTKRYEKQRWKIPHGNSHCYIRTTVTKNTRFINWAKQRLCWNKKRRWIKIYFWVVALKKEKIIDPTNPT